MSNQHEDSFRPGDVPDVEMGFTIHKGGFDPISAACMGLCIGGVIGFVLWMFGLI